MIYELWKQWHKCRSFLRKPLEMCFTHSEDDILIGLASGQLRLWQGHRSAIVTRINIEPQLKILEYLLIGGELEDVKVMKEEIEAWGFEQGCSVAQGTGRRGWNKVLDDYEEIGVVVAKELGDARSVRT